MGTTNNDINSQVSSPPATNTFVYVVLARSFQYNDEYYRFNEDNHSGENTFRKPEKVFLNKSDADVCCAELEAKERAEFKPSDFGDYDNTDWNGLPSFYEVVEVRVA